MMNAKQLVILCISIFLIIKFVVMPITSIVGPASKLGKIKKISRTMGEIIIAFPQKNIYSRKFTIFVYTFFLLLLIFSVVLKSWLYGVFSIVYFSIVLTFFVNYKFTKINGLYENGIVNNDVFLWTDLHSWKIINTEKISILKNNGLRFDLDISISDELIKNSLLNNGISEEK